MKKIILLILCLSSFGVAAKQATPMAKDPEVEKRVDELASELRCLVCQNQTIADSHAALAIDLKNQVRDMVSQGKSKDEVVDYMVKRYGDFVRYKPPVKGTTLLLWFGPALLFIIGGSVLFTTLKRRQLSTVESQSLTDEQLKEVDEVLKSTKGDKKE